MRTRAYLVSAAFRTCHADHFNCSVRRAVCAMWRNCCCYALRGFRVHVHVGMYMLSGGARACEGVHISALFPQSSPAFFSSKHVATGRRQMAGPPCSKIPRVHSFFECIRPASLLLSPTIHRANHLSHANANRSRHSPLQNASTSFRWTDLSMTASDHSRRVRDEGIGSGGREGRGDRGFDEGKQGENEKEGMESTRLPALTSADLPGEGAPALPTSSREPGSVGSWGQPGRQTASSSTWDHACRLENGRIFEKQNHFNLCSHGVHPSVLAREEDGQDY